MTACSGRRRPDASTASRRQRGLADQLRLLRDPGRTRSTRAPRCCSSTGCSSRRTSRRTSTTSATRCRCTGTEAAYEEIVADYPQCVVTVDDLRGPQLPQRQRGQDPGARRGLDRREGGDDDSDVHSASRRTAEAAPRTGAARATPPRRAGTGCGPGCRCPARSGCRCSSSRRCCCSRAVVRHHRHAWQPALRHLAGQREGVCRPRVPQSGRALAWSTRR